MITSEPEFDSLKTEETKQVYLSLATALEHLLGTILTPLGYSDPPDLEGHRYACQLLEKCFLLERVRTSLATLQ